MTSVRTGAARDLLRPAEPDNVSASVVSNVQREMVADRSAPLAPHAPALLGLRPPVPAAPVTVPALLAVRTLTSGLPYLFGPAEEVMIGRSAHIVLQHTLDPLFYTSPPLAFYVFAAAAALIGLVPGVHVGPATQTDPSAVYLAGSAVSALAFVSSVALVYATATAIDGRASGFVASLGLAPAPL